MIDWIIFLVLMAAVLSITTALQSDHVGRILGFTFLALLLLYEPVLVPLMGGTIGHYLCNLRVVDDRTNGNIGFLKAVARATIKSVLGIYSFITMGTTLRHQALHDVLTHSTVQIRDFAKAKAFHYRTERTISGVPSLVRRTSVIVLYLIAIYVVASLALYVSAPDACVSRGPCPIIVRVWVYAVVLAWLAASVACIIYGWRGKLYGCRSRPEPPPVSTDTPS
jgi:RDD family